MATSASPVASSVDVLSADERKLVVTGLEALLASATRARNQAAAAGDSDLVDVRAKRISAVSSLILKFR